MLVYEVYNYLWSLHKSYLLIDPIASPHQTLKEKKIKLQ
jgi:hypothetical protein